MDIKKCAVILNGFLHDFAAGIWLATMTTIWLLHRTHLSQPGITAVLNLLERQFFWISVAAMVVIMATGAGRTFTYVDNWYGADAERMRRRLLLIKHVVLLAGFGAGYWFIWGRVFHH